MAKSEYLKDGVRLISDEKWCGSYSLMGKNDTVLGAKKGTHFYLGYQGNGEDNQYSTVFSLDGSNGNMGIKPGQKVYMHGLGNRHFIINASTIELNGKKIGTTYFGSPNGEAQIMLCDDGHVRVYRKATNTIKTLI